MPARLREDLHAYPFELREAGCATDARFAAIAVSSGAESSLFNRLSISCSEFVAHARLSAVAHRASLGERNSLSEMLNSAAQIGNFWKCGLRA